jgi:antitoxin ParD1/3/4
MTTVTISLPESLRDFIDQQVKSKGYGNVSEYFRGLLRGAQEEEEKKRLETLLLEGLEAGGPDIEVTRAFWAEVRQAASEIIAKRIKRA